MSKPTNVTVAVLVWLFGQSMTKCVQCMKWMTCHLYIEIQSFSSLKPMASKDCHVELINFTLYVTYKLSIPQQPNDCIFPYFFKVL